jgi:hypothetical protein
MAHYFHCRVPIIGIHYFWESRSIGIEVIPDAPVDSTAWPRPPAGAGTGALDPVGRSEIFSETKTERFFLSLSSDCQVYDAWKTPDDSS